MRSYWKKICATALGLAGALLLVPFDSQAMPSFARQTGIPEDADHAMDVILRRKPVRIDTASMKLPGELCWVHVEPFQ